MPDKKYSVFVSSTYKDLREARQRVMFALLGMNCIPAGMELFPAADESQWKVIQRVIGECDYYVLILGGRYGSIVPDSIALEMSGISYTEAECRYALERKIPVLPFLHESPESLLVNEKTGKGETKEKREKLGKFRAFLQENAAPQYWKTSDELYGKVSAALVPLLAKSDRPGWVRGEGIPASRPPTVSSNRRGKNKWAVVGKINLREQKVVGETDLPGNDHCAKIWILQCQHCGFCYGGNGTDVRLRKCPNSECPEMQGGKPCSYTECEAKARNESGNCEMCRKKGE